MYIINISEGTMKKYETISDFAGTVATISRSFYPNNFIPLLAGEAGVKIITEEINNVEEAIPIICGFFKKDMNTIMINWETDR
jgi:hypothetical protein